MQPKHLLIEQSLAQAILNYLQERPFREVHALIGAIVRLQPAPEPKPEAKPNGAQAETAEPSAN